MTTKATKKKADTKPAVKEQSNEGKLKNIKFSKDAITYYRRKAFEAGTTLKPYVENLLEKIAQE